MVSTRSGAARAASGSKPENTATTPAASGRVTKPRGKGKTKQTSLRSFRATKQDIPPWQKPVRKTSPKKDEPSTSQASENKEPDENDKENVTLTLNDEDSLKMEVETTPVTSEPIEKKSEDTQNNDDPAQILDLDANESKSHNNDEASKQMGIDNKDNKQDESDTHNIEPSNKIDQDKEEQNTTANEISKENEEKVPVTDDPKEVMDEKESTDKDEVYGETDKKGEKIVLIIDGEEVTYSNNEVFDLMELANKEIPIPESFADKNKQEVSQIKTSGESDLYEPEKKENQSSEKSNEDDQIKNKQPNEMDISEECCNEPAASTDLTQVESSQ